MKAGCGANRREAIGLSSALCASGGVRDQIQIQDDAAEAIADHFPIKELLRLLAAHINASNPFSSSLVCPAQYLIILYSNRSRSFRISNDKGTDIAAVYSYFNTEEKEYPVSHALAWFKMCPWLSSLMTPLRSQAPGPWNQEHQIAPCAVQVWLTTKRRPGGIIRRTGPANQRTRREEGTSQRRTELHVCFPECGYRLAQLTRIRTLLASLARAIGELWMRRGLHARVPCQLSMHLVLAYRRRFSFFFLNLLMRAHKQIRCVTGCACLPFAYDTRMGGSARRYASSNEPISRRRVQRARHSCR